MFVPRGSEAGEDPHRPEPCLIHRRIYPAGERGRPGQPMRSNDPVDERGGRPGRLVSAQVANRSFRSGAFARAGRASPLPNGGCARGPRRGGLAPADGRVVESGRLADIGVGETDWNYNTGGLEKMLKDAARVTGRARPGWAPWTRWAFVIRSAAVDAVTERSTASGSMRPGRTGRRRPASRSRLPLRRR